MTEIPKKSAHATRIAFRLAARSVRSHRGRSILIAALVAVPMLGMSAAVTVAVSGVPSTNERIGYELGRTQASLTIISPPDATLTQSPTSPDWNSQARDENGNPTGYPPDAVPMSPENILPAGTRILSLVTTNATVRTANGLGGIQVLEGDAGDPSLEGRFHLASGRAPDRDTEIALTPAALTRIGVKVGGTVDIVTPEPRTMTVVGTIQDRMHADSDSVLFARDGAISGQRAADNPTSATFYLPHLKLDWPAVQHLNTQGATVLSREVLENPPDPRDYTIGGDQSWTDSLSSLLPVVMILGGFALFQVALLAGAAFLVGMRSEVRSLAVVASVGGDRRVLFRTVSSSGIVLGLIGGLIGIVLGVAAGYGYLRLADDGNRQSYPGFHVNVWILALVLLVGVGCAWLASLAAARQASHIDVVTALRGARRPVPARTRRLVIGTAVTTVGLSLLAVAGVIEFFAYVPRFDQGLSQLGVFGIVAGAIVVQLGIVLIAPRILRGIARILAGLGVGARIAGRDASRNHSRSVPTAAAITSTVFVSVFLMTLLSSGQAQSTAEYVWDGAQGSINGDLTDQDPVTYAQSFGTADRAVAVDRVLDGVFGPVDTTALSSVLDPVGAQDSTENWTFPLVPASRLCPENTDPNQPDPACDLPSFLMSIGTGGHLWVGSESDLAVLLDKAPTVAAVRMLQSGGAVSFYPEYVERGKVTLGTWTSDQLRQGADVSRADSATRTVTLDAVVDTPRHPEDYGMFVSTATADRLGLHYGLTRFTAHIPAQPTQAQYDSLWAGLATIGPNAWARYEAGPPQYGDVTAWILLGVTAIIALAASGVAIGLARSDAKRDDEVFDAIGAPPRLRRSIAFWQAIVIAGFGTVIGAIVGLLPVLAMTIPSLIAANEHISANSLPMPVFAPPWIQLGLTVIGVPLAIAIGSWLTAARSRIAVRRVA